jgi:hypothetical protein
MTHDPGCHANIVDQAARGWLHLSYVAATTPQYCNAAAAAGR